MSEPTGETCVGCGEPILVGQSVVRLSAGVLLPDWSGLLFRPDVYVHAGTGHDEVYAVDERWCVDAAAMAHGIHALRIHATTGASGGG